jgi:class 3 adenylate cyclase
VAVALFGLAAWRYVAIHRQRGDVLSLAVGVAFVLLGEATVAVALSRNWHLSWWEWHVLMLAGFLAIALGARDEYRRSRSLTTALGGLYSETTLAQIDRWHARAIATVASADARGEPPDRALDELRSEGASEEEIALLAAAARELRRLDSLFRPYLPAGVGSQLRSDPAVSRLGGEERDVTVLFADLAGFTDFSESRRPAEVIDMLNRYWEVVVPVIERSGGVVDYFAGDGVLAIFNPGGDDPEHAIRAVRAGLAIVEAGRTVAQANTSWPLFRVGVNSGRAVVGNVGAQGRRSFTAIGDTTNVAARLLSSTQPGTVAVSGATWAALGGRGQGVALGAVPIKGKRQRVEAWVVTGVS